MRSSRKRASTMMPLLMPLPTTMDPRNAVLEFRLRMLNGGRLTMKNENNVPTASGNHKMGSERHERKYQSKTNSTSANTITPEMPRSVASPPISSTRVGTSPA